MSIAEFSGDVCLHQGWGNPAETQLQGETFGLTIFWLNCLNWSVSLTRGLGTTGRIFCLLHGKHSLRQVVTELWLWMRGAAYSRVIQRLCNLVFRVENLCWTPQGLKNLHFQHGAWSKQLLNELTEQVCALLLLDGAVAVLHLIVDR